MDACAGSTHPCERNRASTPPVGTARAMQQQQTSPGTPHQPARPDPWMQELPRVTGSHVASAALRTKFRMEPVAHPLGLPRPSRQTQQLQVRKVAADPHHMTLVQDAYTSANALTILEREADYARLIRAEELELAHAVRQIVPSDNSLLPRADAVTVLNLSRAHSENVFHLLDAAQFLARDPDVEGNRAAQTTRFAFLTSEWAERYVTDHRKNMDASHTAGVLSGSCTTLVCLTWYAAASDGLPGEVEARSLLLPIPFLNTAAEYVTCIRQEIAQAWDGAGYYPAGRLSRVYSDAENATHAYVQGVVECANDFWKLMRAPSTRQKSLYATTSPNWVGFMAYTQIHLRIISRHLFQKHGSDVLRRLTDPEVYHGILLCQQGCVEEAKAFCKLAHEEECQRMHNSKALYGLRGPRTQDEEALGLHIVAVQQEPVLVGAAVTSYGLKAAPGQSLEHGGGPVCLPRLKRVLVPLDASFLDQNIVCPARRECCDPPEACLEVPQYQAIEDACIEFEAEFQVVGSRERKRTHEELEAKTRSEEGPPTPRIRVVTPPPSEDETRTLEAFRMDVSHPATRLGDAYSQLAQRDGPSPLTAFFSAMSARVGADESISVGFQNAVDLYHDHDRYVERTERQLEELREELQSVKADTDSTASVASVEPELSVQGVDTLLRGIGREWGKGCPVSNFPLTAKEINKIVTLVSLWPGLDSETAALAKEPCRVRGMDPGHATLLQALIAVLTALLQNAGNATMQTILLMYETDLSQFQFYMLDRDGASAVTGPSQVLNADLSTTPLVGYKEKSERLSYYRAKGAVEDGP